MKRLLSIIAGYNCYGDTVLQDLILLPFDIIHSLYILTIHFFQMYLGKLHFEGRRGLEKDHAVCIFRFPLTFINMHILNFQNV